MHGHQAFAKQAQKTRRAAGGRCGVGHSNGLSSSMNCFSMCRMVSDKSTLIVVTNKPSEAN
jgi:hypothetical protein